jgi:hypothetical protein
MALENRALKRLLGAKKCEAKVNKDIHKRKALSFVLFDRYDLIEGETGGRDINMIHGYEEYHKNVSVKPEGQDNLGET